MFRVVLLSAVFALHLLAFSGESLAQSNQGSLKANRKSFIFKNVVALKGESYKEVRYIVLATGQAVSPDVLKKVQTKDAEDNVDQEVGQPYLKAVFQENGELRCLIGMGVNTSFMQRGAPLEGQATISDARIQGTVKLVQTGDFAKEASLAFDVALGVSAAAAPVAVAPPVKPTVSGKFLGNGKDAGLRFVSVYEREPFDDKEAISIVFTEKDHSKSNRPAFDAGFKKFGSALILSVNVVDGAIFGCEVVHSAHAKSPFSAVGQIQMVEFDLAGGNAKGHVSTGGPDDFFDQTWDVDLQFAAPLPEKLRKPKAEPKVAATDKKSMKKATDDDDAPARPAGPKIAVQSLTLPAGAKNVQYKKVVEHITFDSDANVAALAKEFGKSLNDQGWKDGPGSLVGKTNAILKRTKSDASLTIMVQPAGTGSQVKIFTEGLDWSGAAATKPKATSVDKDLNDAKNEINKALKDLPGGIPKDLLKGLD